MGVVLCRMHLKNHILRSNVRLMWNTSSQILALHFKPIRVNNPIRRGHEHVSICWVESHGCSTIWLIPLKRCSGRGSGICVLLLLRWRLRRVKHSRVLRWRGYFVVRWRSFRINEIHSCYVMDASSPLIFSSGKLPDEVFLSMASHLSRCPSDNEIARDISPVPFAVLFQSHQKQSAGDD